MRLLLLATLLGLILRVFWLQNYPIGFTPDEAAFGYNAYSLMNTGRDEWNKPSWSLFTENMESFGDYKLPIYTFFTTLSVFIFGLNEYSTRLPNALLSTLAIPVIYILSRQLFKNSKSIASFSSLFFALSPWSIQLSRGAFEANLVTLFLPLFLVLFLKKKYKYAILILSLNFYTYHAARYISLLLSPLLLFIKPKRILLLLILFIPGLFSLMFSGGSRVSDISILSPTDNWKSVSDRRFNAVINGLPDQVARFFSNKPISVLEDFTNRYMTYFSPQFLFSSGSAETTYGMQPGRGVIYLVQLPLLVLFLIQFIRTPSKSSFLILFFIVISPLAASLSKGPGYAANRASVLIPFINIASAIGISYLLSKFNFQRKILNIGILLTLFISTVFFLESYIYHSPKQLAPGMLYGYREVFLRAEQYFNEYEEIRVSRSLSEPHIYVAFYTSYSPKSYQSYSPEWQEYSKRGLKFLDQLDGYRLEKFRFGSLKYEEPVDKKTLYIGKPEDFPTGTDFVIKVSYPDTNIAVVTTSKNP